MATNKTKSKKKVKKNIPSGIAHINSTFNNTIITITDRQGNITLKINTNKIFYVQIIDIFSYFTPLTQP